MTNSHVPYWWVNNPTLGEFCFTLIGRADIEGSKSNVASDTSSFKFQSSELAVRRPRKDTERTVPSPSPGRHESVHSHHVNGSSSPPRIDGFRTGTPEPSPQRQSFFRSYGSIFPNSLAYIIPSTRRSSPWRPNAVMSTTGGERHSVLWIFKGRRNAPDTTRRAVLFQPLDPTSC
uniref:Uncharacterized protein n=1 Tax=Brassica oleracea var. oleracea TaxID=109376 RepID=A0A0D3AW22_BRAOL